jgi:hypothetical protein
MHFTRNLVCPTAQHGSHRLQGRKCSEPFDPDSDYRVTQYAWKPLAIKDAVDVFGGVLWLDAGSTVTGPLTPVFDALHRDGHFFVQGQDMDCSRWVESNSRQRTASFRAGFRPGL